MYLVFRKVVTINPLLLIHATVIGKVRQMKLKLLLLSFVALIACQSSSSDKIGQEVKREDYLISTEYDTKIHIREVSPVQTTSQIPLIMVHGGGPGATSSFDLPVENGSLAETLANEGLKLFLINIRGWEKSTLPQYDFSDTSLVVGSYQEAVADLESAVNWVLKKEGVSMINLFGWATGGHWVCAYSTKFPETVNKLISLNSLYGVNAPWSLSKYFVSESDSTIFNKEGFFRISPSESLTRSWSRTIPMDDKAKWRDPEVEQAYRKYSSSFGNDTSVMKVPGGYREESFYMSLGKKYWDAKDIEVPALILRTELDFWSRPEDLEAIEKDMVNSTESSFLTIPGTHYVFLDRPERGKKKLVDEILKFLKTDSKH